MVSNRIQWVDNAKALGMFLVFWGHLLERGAFTGQSMLVHDVYKAIYAFHMPFFFLLAGYFFRSTDNRFGSLVVEKFKSRLVPMVFFVGLSTLMWQVPGWWDLPTDDDSPLQATQKFWLVLQGKPATNWPCWFLVCLFMVELLAAEIMPFARTRLRHLVAMVIVGALAWQVASNSMLTANRMGFMDKDWWFWQESTVALGFYLAGHYMKQYLTLAVPDRTRRSLLVMLACIGGFLLLFNRNFDGGLGAVNMSGATHGSWPLFWSTALLGSLAFIHVSSWLPPVKLVSYIGNNTIPLLGLNGLMLEFYNRFLWAWCEPYIADWTILPFSAMVALVSLLLCLPIVFLLNRLLPFLIGRWK